MSSIFSPIPISLTGIEYCSAIEKITPPFEEPSSFVSAQAVRLNYNRLYIPVKSDLLFKYCAYKFVFIKVSYVVYFFSDTY